MAALTFAVTVTDQWSDGKRLHVIGTINPDDGDYSTPGIALSFAATSLQSSQVPKKVSITPRACGYLATYTPGVSRDVGTVRFWAADGNGAPVEHSNAGLAAAANTDTWDLYAIFDALV